MVMKFSPSAVEIELESASQLVVVRSAFSSRTNPFALAGHEMRSSGGVFRIFKEGAGDSMTDANVSPSRTLSMLSVPMVFP